MILYIIQLLITAAIAYLFGSLSSVVIASNFIFHYNLKKLGRGSGFISNFKRMYGIAGFLELGAVELVKDIIPILIGGLLLGIKGHGDVGRAFAGCCLVLGSLFPLFYDLKGNHGVVAMVLASFFVNTSAGAVTLILTALGMLLSKYEALGAAIGALGLIMVAALVVDVPVITRLAIFISVAVIIGNIRGIVDIIRGRAEKFNFKTDLSYKFDEKF